MKKGLRVVATITLVCFLTTQSVWGAPTAGIEIANARELPTYLSIDVPAELGTVDALYEAPGAAHPQFILHIQNAHANYDAQVKIKQLLEYMNKKYGFKTIFVEGASSKMDADYLRLFPDAKRNRELCDALAKRGELTGAELFLMEQSAGQDDGGRMAEGVTTQAPSSILHPISSTQSAVEALGIEKTSLYRSNYDALKKVFGAETDVNRFFSGFDSKLDRVASKTFTPETRQLIADWKRFEQGRREFMPFVRELVKRAKKTLDLDLESLFAQVGWPQISRLLAIQQLEKDLDKEKGLAEKEALIKMLRTKHVSKELLATLESFNEGSIAVGKSATEVSPREILERLNGEAGPQGFKFSDYPAFSLFAGYVTLRSELDAKVLFEEIEYLFTQMLDAMAQDPQQKSLLSLYRDGELLRKLLHLELNRAQWRELLQNRDRMTVEALVTRLKDAVIASGDASVAKNKDVMSKDFNGKMSEIFDAGLNFYDYARQREDVFYQEMKNAMAERKITKAVLITGGFHTDGMSDMFRQNAVSYGIVTPRLSERSNEGLYRSIMMGKHSDAFSVSYLEATVKMMDPMIQFDQQGHYDATEIFEEFMKKINETDPVKVLAAYKAQTPAYQKLLASGLDVVISDGRITLIRAVFGPKAIVTAFQEAVEVSRGSSKHEDLARVTNDAFTAYSDAGAASETVEELRRHFENSSLGEEARSIFLAQLSRSESRGLTAVVKALALGAAISPFGLKAEMPATTEEPAAPAANTAPAIQPVIRGEKGVFTISDIRVTLPVAGVAAAAQGVTTSVTNAATPVFTSILQDAGDTVLGIVVAAEKAALSGFHFEIRGTADLKDWASILEFDYDGAMPKGATVAFGLRIPERLETKFRAVATGRSESREMVNLVVSMAAVGYLALGCATTNVPKGTAEISAPQAVSAKVDSHEAVRALDGKREMIMKDLANSETPVATLVNDLNLILGAQKATTKSNNARMRIAGFRKMVQEAWDGGRLQDPQVKPLAEEIMSITRSESRGHTGLKDPYWGSEHFVFTHRKDGPAPQPGPGDVFRVDLRGGSGTRTIAFKTDAGLEAFRGLEIDADTVKSDIDSLLENAEFNKSRIDRALKRSETLSILLMGWDPEVSSEILPVQDEALGQAIELLLKNSVGVNAERAFPKWRELALADLAARPDLNGTDIKAALTSAARQAELSATGEMVQDVLERVAAATEPVLRAENAVMDAEALRSYFVDDNKQFYAPAWDAFVGAFRARSESRTLLDAYASPEDFMDYLKNVALPHFFNAYPEARNKYQEYRTAFNAGDKVIAKALAKEIDALVTQYNRAINHVGTYASRIQNFDYKTLVQADVAPVADAYSAEETLKGEDLVLEGAEVLEFFAAGAATRLGLGNMFLLSPRKFLKVFEMLPRVRAKDPSGLDAASMKIYTRLAGREDKDLAALEAVAEVSIASLRAMLENNPEFFDLPMGARVLLNRRASVEALVRKRYAGMDESLIQHQIEKSLARQQVSILLNEDVAQEAIAYLHSRDFFGFDRKNIYITVQPTFKGLAPANDVSKTIREVTDSELVNGHGHPSMQKFFAGQAFTVAENGEPQYLTVPLVDALYANGGKILSITRINDIIQYDFDSPQAQGNALDIPVLIAKVKEMGGFIALDDPEQGADEVFELLDNPAKAKGGIFPATPALKAQGFGIMPDTLAFDANRDKVTGVPADPDANGAVERIETAIGGGMPHNRMSQSYKLASLSAARKNGRLKGIPVYLRFREFDSGKPLAFAGETVTGDMAYFLNARAVRQPNRKINDFKEAKNTPTLLQVFAKEDALFKQLGYERYARSESRKVIVEAAMAVGVAGMLGLIGLVSTNYHMRIAERMARSREAMKGLSVSESPVTLGRVATAVRVPEVILKDQGYDSVLYSYYEDGMDAKKFLEEFEGKLSAETAADLDRLQAIVAIAESLRLQAVKRARLIAQGKDLSESDAVIFDLLLAFERIATGEYWNTDARTAFNQAIREAVQMWRDGARQEAMNRALNAYDRYARRSESRQAIGKVVKALALGFSMAFAPLRSFAGDLWIQMMEGVPYSPETAVVSLVMGNSNATKPVRFLTYSILGSADLKDWRNLSGDLPGSTINPGEELPLWQVVGTPGGERLFKADAIEVTPGQNILGYSSSTNRWSYPNGTTGVWTVAGLKIHFDPPSNETHWAVLSPLNISGVEYSTVAVELTIPVGMRVQVVIQANTGNIGSKIFTGTGSPQVVTAPISPFPTSPKGGTQYVDAIYVILYPGDPSGTVLINGVYPVARSDRSESRVTQEEKNDVITFIQQHMPALTMDYSGKPSDMKAAQTLGLMGNAFWTVLVPTDEKLARGGIVSGASDERFSPFKTLFDEGFSGSETKGIRGALSLRQVIARAQTSAELQAILVAAAAAQALASSAPGSAIRNAINAPEVRNAPDLFTAMRDAILRTAIQYVLESAKSRQTAQGEQAREGVVADARWVSISPEVLATPRAFGTNGIRGTGFNVDEIRRMTASTAIELKAEWERTHSGQPLPTLGVAVDPRPQGTEGFSMDFEKRMVYTRAEAEVLAAYGFPVRFYAKPVGSGHMIATTSPSYPAAQQNYTTLMGTASHNEVVDPKTGELQFGFKVFKGNAPIMDDFAAGISNHLNGNERLEIPQLQDVPVVDFDAAVKQGRIEIEEYLTKHLRASAGLWEASKVMAGITGLLYLFWLVTLLANSWNPLPILTATGITFAGTVIFGALALVFQLREFIVRKAPLVDPYYDAREIAANIAAVTEVLPEGGAKKALLENLWDRLSTAIEKSDGRSESRTPTERLKPISKQIVQPELGQLMSWSEAKRLERLADPQRPIRMIAKAATVLDLVLWGVWAVIRLSAGAVAAVSFLHTAVFGSALAAAMIALAALSTLAERMIRFAEQYRQEHPRQNVKRSVPAHVAISEMSLAEVQRRIPVILDESDMANRLGDTAKLGMLRAEMDALFTQLNAIQSRSESRELGAEALKRIELLDQHIRKLIAEDATMDEIVALEEKRAAMLDQLLGIKPKPSEAQPLAGVSVAETKIQMDGIAGEIDLVTAQLADLKTEYQQQSDLLRELKKDDPERSNVSRRVERLATQIGNGQESLRKLTGTLEAQKRSKTRDGVPNWAQNFGANKVGRMKAMESKITSQQELAKAFEQSEVSTRSRQQFAEELIQELTPVEIAMLREGHTRFSPASILQVFCGIVVAVDTTRPGAQEAALVALRSYLTELNSGEFSFERYIENVGRIVANYQVFQVSEAPGIIIRDVQTMPSSSWFGNLALQLATNAKQRVQVVVNKAMISEENCSAIDTNLSQIRKMTGADGKGIRERLTVSFKTDVIGEMIEQAQRLGKASGGLYPVLYTETENVRQALVDRADSLFGTVVFGKNETADDNALAPMRDLAAMKLSQQKKVRQINTPDDLNAVLAELLKELPNVFKFAGKDQVNLENSALAGLANVLQQLISAAATAKSA